MLEASEQEEEGRQLDDIVEQQRRLKFEEQSITHHWHPSSSPPRLIALDGPRLLDEEMEETKALACYHNGTLQSFLTICGTKNSVTSFHCWLIDVKQAKMMDIYTYWLEEPGYRQPTFGRERYDERTNTNSKLFLVLKIGIDNAHTIMK